MNKLKSRFKNLDKVTEGQNQVYNLDFPAATHSMAYFTGYSSPLCEPESHL